METDARIAAIREAAILQAIPAGFARMGVTWNGQYGDMVDPVRYDATDADIKAMVTEAIRSGSVPGITADADADIREYVVDRFTANIDRPWSVIQTRPKTAFGL